MKHKSTVVLLHDRWSERIQGELIADTSLCDSNNEGNWMGWTKKQLVGRGHFSFLIPQLPELVEEILSTYE